MSATTPPRPSRRAATRRKAIVDSDDEDDLANTTKIPVDDEEDFTPEPTRSPRRQTRSRRSIAPAAAPAPAPRARGRPKKTPTPAPAAAAATEPSEIFDADQTQQLEQGDPPKRTSTRKRQSTASRASIATTLDMPPPPPTPKAPASPDGTQLHGSPLADITASSVNTQNTEADDTIKPIKPFDTIMDKPLDIVLKQRTITIPMVEETTTPKSRIVLTYLILNNFKSYAGRQEVGPFHASFSSVVGPNGSGKSNVIDSLLFVFGFRASKMRQGKISALIHNSAQHPNLEFCEVEVHFQEVIDLVCQTPHLHVHDPLTAPARRWPRGRPRLGARHLPQGVPQQLEQVLHQRQGVQLYHGHDPPARTRRRLGPQEIPDSAGRG